MSNYEFKVGDRVKTRDGRDAIVIGVDVLGNLISAAVDNYVIFYSKNGMHSINGISMGEDLMSPKTKKMKMHCWLAAYSLIELNPYKEMQRMELVWFPEGFPPLSESWKRVPSEDKEVWVEE